MKTPLVEEEDSLKYPAPRAKKLPGKAKHKGVIWVQDIPATTKQEFKASCAQADEPMRDAFIRLMRYYVRQKGVLGDRRRHQIT